MVKRTILIAAGLTMMLSAATHPHEPVKMPDIELQLQERDK